MISTNILNLKIPSQDAQGRWYETLSPTQVLTGQQQQQQQQQLQEHDKEKKKKKCRGNRRAQRLRRRLRQRGIDPDTITELVNQRINPQQQHNEAIQNDRIPQSIQHKDKQHDSTVKKSIKRKRNETSSNTIDKSLSQLSISQPSPKKQKMANNEIEQVITNGTSETKHSKSKKQINHNNGDSYIPDYLKVSNRIFKKMLINSLEGAKEIVKRLNSKDKINYIRQYAYLIHRLFYVQLQESQWKYYYDIGIQENIWSGRVSKKWAAMNISQALQDFGNQPLPQCLSEMNPPLDFEKISAMVTVVVRKGQHKLKQQFEYNKKMLKLDSTDHLFVKNIYDFKPNKQQIRSIRNIWKAIQNKKQMKEQIEILKHRIHSNCLPPAFNLLDYTLDKVDKILSRSKQSATNDNDNQQQTILTARRLKKIGRFKYDMLE
ncbi:unnamed protein product [Rotaria sordida]|uniref:Uncharacterized protein n=1 Tax=Rotaria sordida TaxID=392033 RepID=A0A816BY09_9BILA|nr:unnamed protein product [Rotaria sordida]CAF1617505.1 unnamed protein product [Rotaria sordida]